MPLRVDAEMFISQPRSRTATASLIRASAVGLQVAGEVDNPAVGATYSGEQSPLGIEVMHHVGVVLAAAKAGLVDADGMRAAAGQHFVANLDRVTQPLRLTSTLGHHVPALRQARSARLQGYTGVRPNVTCGNERCENASSRSRAIHCFNSSP